MYSEKNAYAEMPVTQKVYKLETPQLLHQPMIVAADVSTSMDFRGKRRVLALIFIFCEIILHCTLLVMLKK